MEILPEISAVANKLVKRFSKFNFNNDGLLLCQADLLELKSIFNDYKVLNNFYNDLFSTKKLNKFYDYCYENLDDQSVSAVLYAQFISHMVKHSLWFMAAEKSVEDPDLIKEICGSSYVVEHLKHNEFPEAFVESFSSCIAAKLDKAGNEIKSSQISVFKELSAESEFSINHQKLVDQVLLGEKVVHDLIYCSTGVVIFCEKLEPGLYEFSAAFYMDDVESCVKFAKEIGGFYDSERSLFRFPLYDERTTDLQANMKLVSTILQLCASNEKIYLAGSKKILNNNFKEITEKASDPNVYEPEVSNFT